MASEILVYVVSVPEAHTGFSVAEALEILERTPRTLRAMLTGLSDGWIACTEGTGSWSPFDVVGHLIHGEKTDWIRRAEIILAEGESRPFEPFDRFAQFDESNGKHLADLLDEFESLRSGNLERLRRMNPASDQLRLRGLHPAFGPVTLSQLLATWVVHDLEHIAQIARVMAKRYTEEIGPWKAYLPIVTRA